MTDETNQLQPQAQMVFVGAIREFQPSVHDIPPGPRTAETNNQLRRGQLHWAGDGFLRPGLYIWTGESNVLVESQQNIMAKMEAAVKDPNGPTRKEDFDPPRPHNEEEE